MTHSTAFWKQLERHPLSQEYADGDLKGGEWDAFVQDMRDHGFDRTKRIILYEGKILDGWQRHRACLLTDTDPLIEEFVGPSPEAFVRIANDRRRHESKAEREKRIAARRARVAQARGEGQSLRTIAEQEKVAESTVRTDLTAHPCAVKPPEKITGKDGRQQPATRPPKPPKAEPAKEVTPRCERCVRVGRDDPHCPQCYELKHPPLKDAEGHKVPECSKAAFASIEKFLEIDRLVRQLQSAIDEVSRGAGGEHLVRCLTPTGSEEKKINKSEHLSALKRDLKFTRPHSVCPYCVGKGPKSCKGCNGLGWVTQVTWKDAPEEVKAKL